MKRALLIAAALAVASPALAHSKGRGFPVTNDPIAIVENNSTFVRLLKEFDVFYDFTFEHAADYPCQLTLLLPSTPGMFYERNGLFLDSVGTNPETPEENVTGYVVISENTFALNPSLLNCDKFATSPTRITAHVRYFATR